MSMRIRRNIRRWTVLAAALVVLAFARAAAADDAAGMRVYRDPATGEFTAPPPEAAVVPESAASGAALGTAPQPLVEEPGSSAAGGVTIDLRGRFRSSQSATVDDAGRVHTHCHTDANGATP